jgi:hypothetical protein
MIGAKLPQSVVLPGSAEVISLDSRHLRPQSAMCDGYRDALTGATPETK